MALTLQLRNTHQLIPEANASRELRAGTMTLGRGERNDWVLADPELVISNQHCVIEATDDRYVLTDTSSNGVYLNGATAALGRGNKAELADGDTLRIGHFEIAVQVSNSLQATFEPATDPLDDFALDDPDPSKPKSGIADLMAEFIADTSAGSAVEGAVFDQITPEADLLELQRSPPPGQPAEQFANTCEDDLTPDPLSAHVLDPPPDPGQLAGMGAGRAESAALRAFLKGAGLEDLQIPESETGETFELLGAIYREVVTGLMDVLAARGILKNEFRLRQTMIQPVGSSPLKFSLGADDAMAILLTNKGQNYLPPLRAFSEAFVDVKVHQVAVLAGMRMALKSLFARFDPKDLEQRVEREKGLGTLLTGNKARCWDEFTRLYETLVADAEDDFERVFGHEFGRAYEEQVRKMTNKS